MNVNNDRSHFTTIPTYDQYHPQAQPHHLLPQYSYPVEQMAAVMYPQPVYSSEGYPQIPVTQPGQERGGYLDPHKMARINRKNAMIRSRNNSSPNSSSPSELVDTKRQVMFNMKNNVQIPEKKDLYPYSTFDNKVLFLLVQIFEFICYILLHYTF